MALEVQRLTKYIDLMVCTTIQSIYGRIGDGLLLLFLHQHNYTTMDFT